MPEAASRPAMLDRSAFPVLLIAGPERQRLAGETLRRITAGLGALGHTIVSSATASDAAALLTSDPSFGCVVLDWSLGYDGGTRPAEAIMDEVCCRNAGLPVFLIVERDDLEKISLHMAEMVQEYVLIFEDTPAFVAGRIDYAWHRYVDKLLPPFFGKLVAFAETHEYSWHTPGHAGGTAFRKSQVGSAFTPFTARRSSVPTCRSRWENSARCSTIRVRPKHPSRTRRGCSAPIPAISYSTARRRPTRSSPTVAWCRVMWFSRTGTATSP
jgi:hypothetical protein